MKNVHQKTSARTPGANATHYLHCIRENVNELAAIISAGIDLLPDSDSISQYLGDTTIVLGDLALDMAALEAELARGSGDVRDTVARTSTAAATLPRCACVPGRLVACARHDGLFEVTAEVEKISERVAMLDLAVFSLLAPESERRSTTAASIARGAVGDSFAEIRERLAALIKRLDRLDAPIPLRPTDLPAEAAE